MYPSPDVSITGDGNTRFIVFVLPDAR